jgi:hypothetical protein
MSNTKKIDNARIKLNYARNLSQEATKMFRELLDDYRSARYNINNDRELSLEGKSARLLALSKVYEKKALEISKALHDEKATTLSEVRKAAESVLTSKLPDVDATARTLFMQKADRLLARATFASNPNDAINALSELVQSADHPVLASEIKPQIMSLGTQLLGSITDPQTQYAVKQSIAQLYDDVSMRSLPEGGSDAIELLANVEGMSRSVVSPVVADALGEISQNARRYVNDPTAYNVDGGDE